MRETSGGLNYHNALIALNCRLLGLGIIASFDRDYDRVDWLKRIETRDEAI
jgi:predicted nucleic acid-binding protein